jgi:predicted TIM-barrel fold metal-dependent hydrolase
LVTHEGIKIKGPWQNVHPLGGTAADAKPPTGGPAGSDRDFLVKQLVGERGNARIVLGHHEGLLSAALPMPYEARATVRALNDWTIDQWLDADEHLFGHLLVVSAVPNEAAAEIRRVGGHEKFVAVALGANGLNRSFGHPAYHPIYEAAAELDLPIVIQVGADNIADLCTSPTSAGLNTTYSEYDAMSAAPLMPHLSSMFTSGLFDLYPKLKVLAVGGGIAWLPEYLWRLDWTYKFMRPVEVPWVDRLPSEYFAEHVRVTTYSMEAPPKAEQLETIFEIIPNIESMLLYASGYPNIDGEDAQSIAARLPQHLHQRVFHDNAEAFYRWPQKQLNGTSAARSGKPGTELATATPKSGG